MRVCSFSHRDRFHNVDRLADGRLTCDCPRFSFGSVDQKTCRHVEIVASADRAIAKCEALGHSATSMIRGTYQNALCVECLVLLLSASAGKVAREFVPKATMKDKLAAARAKKSKKKPSRKRNDGIVAEPAGES